MDELYDQSVDGRHDSADVSSETDRSLRPVDENGQENWAEDAEALTRSDYADQMRQGPVIEEEDDSTADQHQDQDQDDSHEQAVAEDHQEHEELPEPRTRQEVAEESDRANPSALDQDQPADDGLDAMIAEEDKLPEPRTRQAVAAEARSDADPLVQTGRDTQQQEHDWPSSEERALLHETYLDWREDVLQGRERGTNVVGDKPNRSPDDTSDLPPTGEQLLDMDSDKLSRVEQFRREFYKEAEDVADAVEKEGGMVIDLTERPPTGSHTEVPSHQPAISLPADHATDSGQLALAGLVAGVLVFETARRVRNTLEARRRR